MSGGGKGRLTIRNADQGKGAWKSYLIIDSLTFEDEGMYTFTASAGKAKNSIERGLYVVAGACSLEISWA